MRKISDEMKEFAETPDFKNQLADKTLIKKDDGRIRQTRRYRLITPLFGGGVKPRENDSEKLIRETSIRGQLRFWWRAMRGVGTLEEMKKREDALFGSGGGNSAQSKVLIAVKINENGKIDNEGNPAEPFSMHNGRTRPTKHWEKIAYAAFALQPANDELHLPMKTFRTRVEFSMNISFPNDAATTKDIEAALWAWEIFGGIGGRTRRGFGALQLLEVDGIAVEQMKIAELKPINGESKIVKELKQHLAEGTWDANVPHLSAEPNLALTSGFNAANLEENNLQAWEFLIQKLHDFRQSPRIGNVYTGKSHWSEPDEIRRKTGRSTRYHEPTHPVANKFPRAQFGLPIIFKFKNDDVATGDPDGQYTLNVEGQGKDRLASPLILRPVACADGAVGLALILQTPPLPNVELEGYGAVSTQLIKNMTVDDIVHIEPMRYADPKETDVLKSFLKFLEK